MLPFLRLASVPDPQRGAAPAHPITIVLADDHAAMRQSLRMLLGGEVDLEVVAETDSVGSVMAHMRAHRPDVLVLDLGLPGQRSALETLTALSRQAPEMNIVLLTTNDDPAFARRAMEAGARGLVLKEMADPDLPAAVREASHGRRYVSPILAARLAGARGVREEGKLTAREQEVLRLIALGHTSVEIAATLGLSPRTIETHRARIHRKLGLGTRAELVQYAMQRGMLRL
jgi:two-component system, NarL family, response regulator NreC